MINLLSLLFVSFNHLSPLITLSNRLADYLSLRQSPNKIETHLFFFDEQSRELFANLIGVSKIVTSAYEISRQNYPEILHFGLFILFSILRRTYIVGVFNARFVSLPPMLSIVMTTAMKTWKEVTTSPYSPSSSFNTNETIRSVPSQYSHIDTPNISEGEGSDELNKDSMPRTSRSDNFSISSSPTPTQPASPNSRLPIYFSNATTSNGMNKNVRKQISTEFGPTVAFNNNNANGSPSPDENIQSSSSVSQWNSAVGRAGLGGKSGRVIERLMGDNDMLKRDLKIERLRAEENKQAVKLAEGKMEALAAEYDSKLHDAAINKTLLKRKERQLADLRLQVEAEKARANIAAENERIWKYEIDKVEKKAKQDVEDAMNYASMMEARNNAMTKHWKDQGIEVNRTVVKLSKEIEEIVLERKHDDERLNTLQGLCDQQATQLSEIVDERNAIANKYEEYKRSQEEAVRDIKAAAREQEEKSELLLAETLKALNELKWALGVNKFKRDL